MSEIKMKNLAEILALLAVNKGDKTAFRFYGDKRAEDISLSWRELDAKTRAIAATLNLKKVEGERVVLLCPSSMDFIAGLMGCMYAGAIAVPLYPPRTNRNLQRIKTVIKDSQAKFALTNTRIFQKISKFEDQNIFSELDFLTVDSINEENAQEFKEIKIELNRTAFLQYTSGSTSAPKGVVVTHENLIHNQECIKHAFDQNENSRIVSWLPLFHDMGLIGNVLQTIYTGSECVLMSPTTFLQKPLNWLKAISRFGATTSGAPTFGYELCNRIKSDEEIESLDLATWKTAFCGAEPVRAEILLNFARRFSASGFSAKSFAPCYGLAEATLLVSARKGLQSVIFDEELLGNNQVKLAENTNSTKNKNITDCGEIASGLRVKIVNPETFKVCSADEIGEIWISGASVANGYWNNKKATTETFRAEIKEKDGTEYLRTGDLGFKRENSLFVTGRLKDLIIVRGRNYYPADIELTAGNVNSALSVSATAAVNLSEETEEKVWIIAETDRKTDFSHLAQEVVKTVAEEHDLRLSGIVFIRRGTIPKTSSGKIRRGVCRELLQNGNLHSLYCWTEEYVSEKTSSAAEKDFPANSDEARNSLQKLIAERLGINEKNISPENSLIELGTDSLTATEISFTAEEKYGLKISVSDILRGETIKNLADSAFSDSDKNEENIFQKSSDAVSHGQQALYFLQQLEPRNTAYNVAVAVRLSGGIDADMLEKALKVSINSHEQLRSNFCQIENRIKRITQSEPKFELKRVNLSGFSSEELSKIISRKTFEPFNLETDSLIRAYLYNNTHKGKNEEIFLLLIHHIICDFWSLQLLAQEIGENYSILSRGETIKPTKKANAFSTFADRERDLLASNDGEKLWNYWRETLEGEIAPLNLPTDFSRPANQTFKGAVHSFEVSAELTAKLEAIAKNYGVTLYVVLLAAYQIFLSKYAGQDKFLVGSPFTGRQNKDSAQTFGYFVNTLPLRADLTENPAFSAFVQKLSDEANQARAHAEFPFSLMVERLRPERESSRSPLFQTVFTWQQTAFAEKNWAALVIGNSDTKIALGDLICRPFPLIQQTAQFDISLQAARLNDALFFSWQYNTELFKPATIRRMSAHFSHLLCEIAEDENKKVSAYDLLNESEKQTQIKSWNETKRQHESGVLLHELVERQAELTPNNIALEFENESLTYAELNAKANQLAHHLREIGIKPEMTVGVALSRSLELVIALLGIVKSGAAYVPLDPSYPRERFAYMLDDAGVKLLITNKKTSERTDVDTEVKMLFLDLKSDIFNSQPINNPTKNAHSENAAYVIFTSGSTGNPKGAVNSHSNIVNRLFWMQEAFRLNETDAVLQKTPFSFDVSVWEFFWTLMFGARLVIAKPDGHTDSQYLTEIIERKQITTLHFVPSMLNLFLQDVEPNRGTSLKRVICSGEALPFELQQNFFETFKNAELHNLYGPTEAAIDVSWHVCQREGELQIVPIGKPIANTQLYVLDEQFTPVPVGVLGELFIGGANVGRGYSNKPALTAEKFIPDLFGKSSGARLYRTGDIARYLADGSIEYVERRDGQIKLRGQRIELGEIQTALLSYKKIVGAAVIVRTDEKKHLILTAYYVSENDLSVSDLRGFLEKKLPRQMIPNHFARLKKLPLSPNGKLDRKALPSPDKINDLQSSVYSAPISETQTILIKIWREVLGIGQIGIDDNFFALGGDSIRSIQVRAKSRESGLDFELQELFRHQTVRSLATVVRYYKSEQVEKNGFVLSEEDKNKLPKEAVNAYPLTRLQTGLVFHQEHDSDYEIYVTSLRVSGKFDEEAMRKAVEFVTKQHEILRTSFEMSKFSEPLQVVLENIVPNFQIKDLTEFSENERETFLNEWLKNERTEAFVWTNAPLARFTIHYLSADHFQVTLSEPVLDGWSVATLLSDLLTVYAALIQSEKTPELPAPPSYFEYVQLEKNALSSEIQREFWRKNLQDFEGCFVAEKTAQKGAGIKQTERIYVEIAPEISRKIFDFAAKIGVPLKNILLAAHLKAISLTTNQPDVCTALLYNGRPETSNGERAVGLFLNAVPFRLDLENLTLAEIAQKSFSAETELLPNRRFPLSEILRLHGKRSLFDTAFNYTHFHAYQSLHSIEGLKITDIYASDQTYFTLTSQFNLNHESDKPDIRLAIDFRPLQITENQVRNFADCLFEILKCDEKNIEEKFLFRTARAGSVTISPESSGNKNEKKDLAGLIERIERMSDEDARILKKTLTKNRR